MKFYLGRYEFDLPRTATLSGNVLIPPTDAIGAGSLSLVAVLGEFRFSFRLDPRGTPNDLADSILAITKKKVKVQQVEINGIAGVTYGSYNPSRSWFDWWLKKGETMLCINLQSQIHPYGHAITTATAEEIATHHAIIESIRYIPDSI